MKVERWRLAQRLHERGVHALCRVSHVRVEECLTPLSYQSPDGTVFTPDFNGVLGKTFVHYRVIHS